MSNHETVSFRLSLHGAKDCIVVSTNVKTNPDWLQLRFYTTYQSKCDLCIYITSQKRILSSTFIINSKCPYMCSAAVNLLYYY